MDAAPAISQPCILVINPTAGGYRPAWVEQACRQLTAAGWHPEVRLTANAADAEGFAAEASARGDDPLVVAGGGDGTVNGVVNGLTPGMRLAVLPLGTANVLAKELGVDTPERALQRIIAGEYRSLPVGELQRGGERRRFVLMAGAGFDGAAVNAVCLEEKRRLGFAAYLLAGLRSLVAWDPRRFPVRVAGRQLECHSVIVSRAARYGGHFLLAPAADLFVPELQVVCITGNRRRDLLRLTLRVLAGKGAAGPGVELLTAASVAVGGDKPLQLDGDAYGAAPVEIRVVPDFVRIVV